MNWAVIIPGNIMESFIIYNYWFSLLEMRYSRKKSIAVFVFVGALNAVRCWLMFNMVSLKAIITHIVMLALMQILFKDKWYKKLLIHSVYIACVFLSEYIAVLFAKYIYHYDMVNLTEASLPCFLWQGTAYLLIFIFNTIALLLLKSKKAEMDDKVIQYIFIYVSVQCLMAFVFTMFIFEYKITSTLMILMIFFVLIASSLIGILLYRMVRAATIKTMEAEYIRKESDIKDKHFKELKEQYLEYRKLRHDFANHLRVIKELKDADKLRSYTEDIEERLEKIAQKSYCDNLTVDALLSLKKNEAERSGINVGYEICRLGEIYISDFDLCTVIANLLDNAIEAAGKTDEKSLFLQINKKMDRLIITVKNSSPPVDDSLKTTKANSGNHGIGIKSIKTAAAKYDGDFVFKYENSQFTGIVNMSCTKQASGR